MSTIRTVGEMIDALEDEFHRDDTLVIVEHPHRGGTVVLSVETMDPATGHVGEELDPDELDNKQLAVIVVQGTPDDWTITSNDGDWPGR